MVTAPDHTGESSMEVNLIPQEVVQCLIPGVQKCAIVECPNPCYSDENGTVHKCCGRTHAKEYEKRQCKSLQYRYKILILHVNVHFYL